MRDCERIVQVTHVKKATVSESLRSLKTNERISESFVFSEQITHLLFCSQKPAIRSNFFLTKIKFLKRFLSIFFKQAICSFPLFNEGMSNVSESLRSFTKNEWPCGILSGLSPKMSKWANCLFFEQIDHLLIFSQKRVICSENRWANFQPWFWLALSLTSVVIMDSFNIYSLYSFSLLSSSEQ